MTAQPEKRMTISREKKARSSVAEREDAMTQARLKKLIAAIVEEGVEERAPPSATAKRLIKLLHELGLI